MFHTKAKQKNYFAEKLKTLQQYMHQKQGEFRYIDLRPLYFQNQNKGIHF